VPELVEVEAYRRLAERAALGRPVAAVELPGGGFARAGSGRAELVVALVAEQFVAARRHGKLLLLDTSGGPVVGLRFGMTGRLVVDGEAGVGDLIHAPAGVDARWDRLVVAFADGGHLRVNDPRRFGSVELDPDRSRLGPDALALDAAGLDAALGSSASAVKTRLLDQGRVAGIGNLTVDEVLWRAGVSPLRPTRSLRRDERCRLHAALVETLMISCERGGSHTGDHCAARHRDGRCPLDGTLLTRSSVGGRPTWWCAHHQR